nr:hypothetical protein Iba_chr12bCG23840 [Ipomoea batatas]
MVPINESESELRAISHANSRGGGGVASPKLRRSCSSFRRWEVGTVSYKISQTCRRESGASCFADYVSGGQDYWGPQPESYFFFVGERNAGGYCSSCC